MPEEKSKKITSNIKRFKMPLIGIALFFAGAIALFSFRFVTYKSDEVHHHANFALYINGQKDEFKSFTFYEEISACRQSDPDDVHARVHMHDSKSGLVHVHAHGVTWGQFFANLGYAVGDKVLETENDVYVDGQDSKRLSFVLNGQTVSSVQDKVIKSEDKLLINYGNQNAKELNKLIGTVPGDAHQANIENDPASCSGGSHDSTNMQRLKAGLGLPIN